MAGAPPPAGGLRASLTRAAARLTTPVGYLGVLGGLQMVLLWVLRERYGTWLALVTTVVLIALLALLVATRDRWREKLGGVCLLGALTAIGPTLIGVVQRIATTAHAGGRSQRSVITRAAASAAWPITSQTTFAAASGRTASGATRRANAGG